MPDDPRRRRPGDTRPLTVHPRPVHAQLLRELAQWRVSHPDLVQLVERQTAGRLGVDAAWRADDLDDAGLRDLLDVLAMLVASGSERS